MKKNVLILSLVLLVTVGIFLTSKDTCEVSEKDIIDKNELQICEETGERSEENKIINILLLGIDKEENASDTMIILSYNKDENNIKLVSIMRDLYVYQGQGKANKINYAYHYGGVEGSLQTVNNLFDLDIEKYIKVTFEDLIEIVDYIDGVEVYITEEEKECINGNCTSKLLNSGNVILNGEQALAYSRIRKIDSDFKRTERQRNVMTAIFKKAKTVSITKYPKIINYLKSIIETNLSFWQIFSLGKDVVNIDNSNITEFRIPIDGTSRDNTEGVYHLDWNEDVNKKALWDFLDNNA